MNKREKLIEEAAKAIVEVEYPEIAFGLLAEGRKEFRRRQARAALAVFEKAHTPTDDERETLDAVIEDSIERWGDEYPTPQVAAYVAADVRAAGFRRPVVPEPSTTCPKCGVTVSDQTPSTFYPHHDEACGGPLEEPQGEPATEASAQLEVQAHAPSDVAQGEPSNAQVQRFIRKLWPLTGERLSMDRHGPGTVGRIRDALRAASVATEKGRER